MKKINNIKTVLVMLILAITTTSCGDFEPVIFNPETGQTFVSFENDTTTIIVTSNTLETLNQEISVLVTTVSDVDRTVRVAVDLDNEFLTANPNQYTVENTVTIPAGEFFGTFTVNGIFENLTSTTVALVLEILSVDGEEDASITIENHTVTMRRIG